MNGWFPALRLARSSSTRPRHWPVLAVLRPRSRGSHNSAPDTRLVPSCVTTIGSTTSTDHANRARTASRDSIVTQYRTRFAGMTKCRIANMQVTTFHGTRCDPRIALCSFPPTGRLTVNHDFYPWGGLYGPISVPVLVWHNVASTERAGSVGSARPRFGITIQAP